ncbi:MAG: acyltransferase [Cyclobacteriaceae bacterium]
MKFKEFVQYLFNFRQLDDSRLAWIDYAKGIAIVMIVFRHVNTGFWDASVPLDPLFYDLAEQVGLTFRMPLYFLLSGIFFFRSFTKRGIKGYTVHKFNTIMYPYFIWGIILMFLQFVFSKYVNGKFDSLSDFLTIFYDPWGHWWFLYALFVVSVLYMLLFQVSKGNRPVILLISLTFYFLSYRIGKFYVFDDILELMVFFTLGDMVAQYAVKLHEIRWLNRKDILTLAILIAFTGEYLLFTMWRDVPLAILIFAIFGSFAASLVCLHLSRSHKIFGILRVFGQHSLYIYLFHAFTAPAMRVLLIHLMGIENIIVLEVICFASGLIGSIVVYRFIKYFNGSFLFVPPGHR